MPYKIQWSFVLALAAATARSSQALCTRAFLPRSLSVRETQTAATRINGEWSVDNKNSKTSSSFSSGEWTGRTEPSSPSSSSSSHDVVDAEFVAAEATSHFYATEKSVPTESLASVLEKLLNDEEFQDLKLEGNDGVRVSCNRCVLAVRSPVLRNMLISAPNTKETPVKVGYSGDVIRLIVDYCYSNASPDCDKEEIETIASLLDAAEYFDLAELKQKTQRVAYEVMKKNPGTACRFLGATDMEEQALKVIRADPFAALLEGTAALEMDSRLLAIIITDERVEADELTLFRALKRWMDADERNRKSIAMDLAKNIQLDEIDPLELQDTVEKSGLVTQEQLLEAYKMQALKGRAKENVDYNQYRYHTPSWPTSNTNVFDYFSSERLERLDCRPMESGVHSWTIDVLKATEHSIIQLGVACPNTSGVWMYGDLDTYKQGWKSYHQGAVVTFVLDLTGEGNGTLSASVDNGDMAVLFRDILDYFDKRKQTPSLVPAVQIHNEGSIRFLGFEGKPL